MGPYPAWLGPARTPGAGECSLAWKLAERAKQAPAALFAAFSDGSEWSNEQAYRIAGSTAAAIFQRGVRRGDRVINWLPNGAAHLRVLLGSALLGAIPAPLNPALRGKPLEDAVRLANARLLVSHSALADRLSEIDRAVVGEVAILGAGGEAAESLLAPDEGVEEAPAVQPWDLGVILYTSGTTGGVKAVRVPNGHLWSVGEVHFGFLEPTDRVMLTTPLCHIGPLAALVGAINAGASVVVLEAFKTSTFWDDVRRFKVTAVPGMGPSLLHFLNKAPPHPEDRNHGLRLVNVVAANDAARTFSQRFGVSFFPSFGMTELSVPIVGALDCAVEGSCGCARDGMEVRLVDENDMEVPIGQTGEIVVRARDPWVVNDGYVSNPEATVAAWRNGWFHTGDAAYRDADGNFFFADRIKDIIRRRGENISSIGTNVGIGSQGIVIDGTDEQKREWLPKLATGEAVASFALTEPDAGSDAASIRTRAERNGDHFVITGSKRYITNASRATILTLMARTGAEGAGGISAFIVPIATPGVEVGKHDRKMGQHGTRTCDISFDGARVPATAVVGGPANINLGFKTAMKVLDRGRLHMAGLAIGQGRRLMNEICAYALERKQFGSRIADFQLVQAMIADSETDLIASTAMTKAAALAFDNGQKIAREAACAKLFATEAVGRIADRAVQIFGGAGYMSEYPIERIYRDVRLMRIYEGTSQIQQLIIAKSVLNGFSRGERH